MNRACFPKEKHQNSQKWAKFMNFSFCPFLWFGLPGRLLTLFASRGRDHFDRAVLATSMQTKPLMRFPSRLLGVLRLLYDALVAPYRAILRYYRCDTPYRAILFEGSHHSPKWCDTPPLVLSFAQAHLCDTPFCYVSRDNCAIPH